MKSKQEIAETMRLAADQVRASNAAVQRWATGQSVNLAYIDLLDKAAETISRASREIARMERETD